jgi:hypothetical protein
MNRLEPGMRCVDCRCCDAVPTGRTAAEIESHIAAISGALKGPLPNPERIILASDRRLLQRELAAVKEKEPHAL